MSSALPELHHRDGLGDQVRGTRPEDVDAKHAVGLRIGEDLHEAFRLVHAASAAVGAEWELADAILAARFLELLLRQTDARPLPARCK